MDAAVNLK